MAKSLLRAALVGTVLLPAGCFQLQSDYNDYVTAQKDNWQASRAWRRCDANYKGQIEYIHDFGAGFRAGYLDVLNGGAGCPPTLPPAEYWGVRYQNETGKQRIHCWFAGFSEGVAVAESEGVRGQNTIPMSPFRQSQLQTHQTGPSYDPTMHGTETIPPAPGSHHEQALPLAPVTQQEPQALEEALLPSTGDAAPLSVDDVSAEAPAEAVVDPSSFEDELEFPAGLSGLSTPE
jgi:hypothetical protein